MPKQKSFVVRINEKELNEFNKILKQKNINRSALFRSWIREYIDKNKGENNE